MTRAEAPARRTISAVLTRRLAALGLAAFGVGIAEGARVGAASPGAAAVFGNLTLCWGLWWAAALVIGLPWLAGSLSPWWTRGDVGEPYSGCSPPAA